MSTVMPFDPTVSDKHRVCERVDKEYPDAWVQLITHHGQPMIKVEVQSCETVDTKTYAQEVEETLCSYGLRTNIHESHADMYEITATTDMWNSS